MNRGSFLRSLLTIVVSPKIILAMPPDEVVRTKGYLTRLSSREMDLAVFKRNGIINKDAPYSYYIDETRGYEHRFSAESITPIDKLYHLFLSNL